jgi:WD40 repeat protein
VSVSSDGTKLLSFATDGTFRSWDIKPFCSGGETRRQLAIYEGSINNFELLPLKTSWWNSHDTTSSEDLVSCGSADGIVRIWNAETAKIVAAFGGHLGPTLSVEMHPKEKIIASAGFDKQIFLSDINNGLIVE